MRQAAVRKPKPHPPVTVQPPAVDRSAAVRAPKVPELMANDIRKRILRRELTDGDTLPPESELMLQYGVSRPTLREALRILEAESLIVIRRGGLGGALVQRPRLDVTVQHFGLLLQDRGATVRDVYQARTVIEPPALAALATIGTAQQFLELRERLAAAETSIGSAADFFRSIAELRETIAEFTGQVTLTLLMKLLRNIGEAHMAVVSEAMQADWAALQRRSQRSHARLLDLLEARDTKAAELFWRSHMDAAGKYLLSDWAQISIVDLLA